MESKDFDLDDYLDVRSANDWLRAAKTVPMPKMLFGEMWFEGEIAILFGDTGVGKSALAVQIGEAVARGRLSGVSTTPAISTTPSAEATATPPNQGGELRRATRTNQGGEFGAVTARAQTVLYLDFELSAKQFEMRYAAEHDTRHGDLLKNHYRFSDRLKRVALKPDVFRQDGDLPFETAVRRLIEPLIERTGARVLIVDNITYLKRTADNSRDAAPLMKELKRLKEQFGLSILVIAHTPKRDVKRPLVLNDMQGSKVIANFADSVFAIGQSRRESNERYIKHIKQRSSEMLHNHGALPVFHMGKLGGNFLGLDFRRYAAEPEMLIESADSHVWATIQKVKDLTDAGMPIRQVANQLGLSKSAAHRNLQMWHPNNDWSGKHPCLPGCEADENAEQLIPSGKPGHEFYFPGREEYDEASANPRFDDLFADESPANYLLRREAFLIESASARARKQYHQTGTAPGLNDDAAYVEFMATTPTDYLSSAPLLLPSAFITDHEPIEKNPVAMAPGSDKIASPLDRMELVIDDYGKNRYVESRHENGKLRVWYQYRSDGALLRHEHRGFGTFSDLADPLVFGSCARSVDTPVRTDASASETPFAVSGDADKSVRVPFVSAFR